MAKKSLKALIAGGDTALSDQFLKKLKPGEMYRMIKIGAICQMNVRSL
jgi:hypothetical protein